MQSIMHRLVVTIVVVLFCLLGQTSLSLVSALQQPVAHHWQRQEQRHVRDPSKGAGGRQGRWIVPRQRSISRVVLGATTDPSNHCVDDDDGSSTFHTENAKVADPSRRQWLTRSVFMMATNSVSSLLPVSPAHAALLQFPCAKLKNRYHFMRAGLSELEAQDIYASNALFLTNRENCLVETNNVQQSIVAACQVMRDAGQTPTVAYHSLAANGMDTADLVARTLLLARDRLLPEFTYLDPRGIGLWDGTRYSTTRLAVAAMDYQQAGALGSGARPPANTDGTPNETLADQFIRLRQFFSLQESRTSGENILVIFPDGTGPALASAMIAGLPLNTCHALEFAPGEIRLDITQQSVMKLYQDKKDDPAYLTMLEQGQDYLQELQQESAIATTFVNRKDRLAEEERVREDLAFAREQQRKQREAEQKREQALVKLRQQEIQAKLQRQQQQLQQEAASVDLPKIDPALVVGATLGATVGGMVLVNGGNVAKDDVDQATVKVNGDNPLPQQPNAIQETGASTVTPTTTTSSTMTTPASPLYAQPIQSQARPEKDATDTKVEQELESLEAVQDRFMTTLMGEKPNRVTPQESPVNGDAEAAAVRQELETLERGQDTMNNFYSSSSNLIDDGGDDWLRVLAEIRDEADDD